MAEQAHPSSATRHMRPEMSAWLMLIGFFLVFCVLIAVAGYAGWRYYTLAMLPQQGTVLVHTIAGVGYQSRGTTKPDIPQSSRFSLNEGDRVRSLPDAGYGPVASVVLSDQTQIDLWGHPTGADLLLERYRVSRWNESRQEVVFRQSLGYARYDVRAGQPYGQVSYSVVLSDPAVVELAPGGSYSINVFSPRTARGEVAVRAGSARVIGPAGTVVVLPGQMVEIDAAGRAAAPVAATWDLIADGGFTEHSVADYWRGSESWTISGNPLTSGMSSAELNGTFNVVRACPPQKVDLCEPAEQVNVGQFRREGNQDKPFGVGIEQTLDADVSEYTSLRLSAWVRVITQSVEMAGELGTECPIMIFLTYKQTSPTDQQIDYKACVYTGAEARVKAPEIDYFARPPFGWHRIEIELRNNPALKPIRYLQKIRVEARGHDYVSEITAISLIGRQ